MLQSFRNFSTVALWSGKGSDEDVNTLAVLWQS